MCGQIVFFPIRGSLRGTSWLLVVSRRVDRQRRQSHLLRQRGQLWLESKGWRLSKWVLASMTSPTGSPVSVSIW